MEHIVGRNWKNRSKRIKVISKALNHVGEIEVECLRGRNYLSSILVGEGNPRFLNERDELNLARIKYQGKDALEIYFSRLGVDGRFFTENFSEPEIQQIKDALAEGEIYTWQGRLNRYKLAKYPMILLVGVGSAMSLLYFQSFDIIGMFLGSILTLISLFILLYK